jgi:hypothetical protein
MEFIYSVILLVSWDRPLSGLLYQPRMVYDDERGANSGMIGRRNQSTRIKCTNATLPTTNPTLPDKGSNPGRPGEKPVTTRLSYGTA